MNTTGRSSGGTFWESPYCRSSGSSMRSPSSPTSLLTAAVAPEPQKSTISSSPAETARATTSRAFSRRAVVMRPVDETAVWVLA